MGFAAVRLPPHLPASVLLLPLSLPPCSFVSCFFLETVDCPSLFYVHSFLLFFHSSVQCLPAIVILIEFTGWEWDDANVVHLLPALLEGRGVFP